MAGAFESETAGFVGGRQELKACVTYLLVLKISACDQIQRLSSLMHYNDRMKLTMVGEISPLQHCRYSGET